MSSPKRHKMTRFNATCVAVALSVGVVALVVSLLFGEQVMIQAILMGILRGF